MTPDSCRTPLSQFGEIPESPGPHTYIYEGQCPTSGKQLRLPRTHQVEAIAHHLLQQLQQERYSPREGKMFGVLLVRTESGERAVLQAFSGLLDGQTEHAGWAPMIPGRNAVAWEETRTLALLEQMKQELIQLWDIPARHQLKKQEDELEHQRLLLRQHHQANKAHRQQQRKEYQATLEGTQLEKALAVLGWKSQEDKRERQKLWNDFKQKTRLLRDQTRPADREIQRIKKERRQLSRSLQAYMQTVYRLTNFAGIEMSLREILPDLGIPTGTGECCAPKLLHYAATQRWKPLALAEFWYGPSPTDGNRHHGQFYGACAERCQPIMGFLLSGITEVSLPPKVETNLHIVYEDNSLLVVDKPSGLLSVPGRYLNRQDSVASRVRNLYPDVQGPLAVHRLDQETSGLLLLAKTLDIHKQLSAQFRQHEVHKQYEAVLDGVLETTAGTICLPLADLPGASPRQVVNYDRGKPSETHYQVVAQTPTTTRVRFTPVTGRTHQLRVHAAHPNGLNAPIKGDPFYGRPGTPSERLCLHACELKLHHPVTGQDLHLVSNVPF